MTAVRATPRSSPGMNRLLSVRCFDGLERGDDGLDGQAPAGDQLAAGLAECDGDRRRPAVLPDEDGGRGAGLEGRGSLLEVVVTEEARRRALELGEAAAVAVRGGEVDGRDGTVLVL